ncbi:MAG: alcohol dehydrogenase catalytic domain-containing protein [Armatimonadetes bacterium]|nr:alcohol dehydrogenase catalytic domain-containing protein [Armatimonadota bacterium]
MKAAKYIPGGSIQIVEVDTPNCPPKGLLVKTEACGLCSGELMSWYMDRKHDHVIGHEVSGTVMESQDERFPVGSRVFAHHHAPCMKCDQCLRAAFVHCPQWKATRLDPGGMAEFFAVSEDNLNDTHLVDDLSPRQAALIEPLACVFKGIRKAKMVMRSVLIGSGTERVAIIGAGALGLMHGFALPKSTLIEQSADRIEWASGEGLEACRPEEVNGKFDAVFVCPGNREAMRLGFDLLEPEGTLVMFAPLPPQDDFPFLPETAYFKDISLVNTYSCGPADTSLALKAMRKGVFQPEQIVSDFISIDELPEAYQRMKSHQILKAMVEFPA